MQIIRSDAFGGRKVVFDSIIDEVPGGAGLNVDRLDYEAVGKEYIEEGTPVYFVPSTRVAEVCKSALAIDGGGATTPRISKKNHFLAGDFMGDGTTTALITAIDRLTSEDYDIVTVNTALIYAAGTKYVEGTVTGTSAVLKYSPNGLVRSPEYIHNGNADVPIVTIGSVREDALTYPLPDLYKIALRGGVSGTGKSLITVN